jgi:hypothetical protein
MAGVDKPGHDDAPGGVDHRRVAGIKVRSDSEDLLVFDQHIGLRKIVDLRVQRHDRAATNDVAPSQFAAVDWGLVRCAWARREQIGTCSRKAERNVSPAPVTAAERLS